MINFKKLAKPYYNDAIKDLQGLLKINSVYDEKTVTKNKPYGEGVFKCFEYVKKLAVKEGFKVDSCDNHALEIIFNSNKKDVNEIGIFAHLDVVPVSGKWKYPPFKGEIHNGKIYARGASDDKGPAMAAFYALKLLKDNNLINNYKVRMVLGGDEERGSSCLKYYFEKLKKKPVTYGITPDGEFPLVYGEKGIRNYEYIGNVNFPLIEYIDAGFVSNAVIDSAKVKLLETKKIMNYLSKNKNINYKILNENKDSITLEFVGVSAHGSTPEDGVNSGVIMLKVLSDVYKYKELKTLYECYKDYNGKSMHKYFKSKDLGVSTYNVGIIKYSKNRFNMIVNFRYPETVDSKKVINSLKMPSDKFKIKLYEEQKHLYFDPKKNEFINVLYESYKRETKDYKNKPLTLGGGTYAKEALNTVAFGSHFQGKVDNIHSTDEKIDVIDFTKSIAIYADAIYSLGQIKK